MKRIIHLSDLHIGHEECMLRFDRIATNIIFEKLPANQYVIVITGDLVQRATNPANYADVKLVLEKLKKEGFTVLVCPGNHDYGSGGLGDQKYVSEFKKTFFDSTHVTYPKLDIVGDEDGMIAFIGLDSMAEELHWYDRIFAEGELGNAQLNRLEEMLSSQEVVDCAWRVVYLHHHPFDALPFHRLKDTDKLKSAVSNKIDALLYGHNHAGKKHNGHWGIPRCYDAGTSTRKNGDAGPHRIINLAKDARWDYDADFY